MITLHTGKRFFKVRITSINAALGYADKTAILLGEEGIFFLYYSSNKPSCSNDFFKFSNFKNNEPTPSGSIFLTIN